jgi:hypothetical protein
MQTIFSIDEINTQLCLELSSFNEQNPSGYDDFPDFISDIWPFLISHRDSIKEVVLQKSTLERLFSFGKINGFQKLGAMGGLQNHELSKLKHRSFYGGHLSAIYQTTDKNLVTRLCRFWRKGPRIIKFDDIPGVTPEFAETIVELIVSDKSCVCISFAHDADPMYLFGNIKTFQPA